MERNLAICPIRGWAFRHIFNRICDEHGIAHRFTNPTHP